MQMQESTSSPRPTLIPGIVTLVGGAILVVGSLLAWVKLDLGRLGAFSGSASLSVRGAGSRLHHGHRRRDVDDLAGRARVRGVPGASASTRASGTRATGKRAGWRRTGGVAATRAGRAAVVVRCLRARWRGGTGCAARR